MTSRIRTGLAVAGLSMTLGAAGGYWFAQRPMTNVPNDGSTAPSQQARKVLYWYDPMYPQQKFDKPGKSPFMDMALMPQYAGAAVDNASISVDPGVTQNLGLRLATVTRGPLADSIEVVGVLALNDRDVAVVQARAAGFVERTYARAPDDVIKAGAPLVDLLIPDWAGAQEEFLALERSGDADLLSAARQRLRLLGMPAELIRQVQSSGKPKTVLTLGSPIGGVVQALGVRTGMAVAEGATLARINGLGRVWLNLAVPEAGAGGVVPGQAVEARLPAFPGEVLTGTVDAVLPEASTDSRTLRVRVELDNPQGRLKPGMTAIVRLNRSTARNALWLPSEAIIRTGRRALVMVAEDGGHYRPVEVRLGPENASSTVVTQGLAEGQQVVASGQFLLDSEASLKGLIAAPGDAPEVETSTSLHETQGQVLSLANDGLTLDHGPFKTLGMPAMTMTFALADPALMNGIKVGDRVHVEVRQTGTGLLVERLEKLGGQP